MTHSEKEVERLVTKFGEKHRKLISDALEWLEENEKDWCLSEPIKVDEFIEEVLRGVV